MNENIEKLIKENLELTKENNKMLRKIRSYQKWQQITRALYILIIIGVTLGAFVYLQPIIKQITSIFSGSENTEARSYTIPDLKNLQGLYDQLNKLKK